MVDRSSGAKYQAPEFEAKKVKEPTDSLPEWMAETAVRRVVLRILNWLIRFLIRWRDRIRRAPEIQKEPEILKEIEWEKEDPV